MIAVLWMLAGAGVLIVVTTPIAMAMSEDVRRDVAAALLGALALPVMVPVTVFVWFAQRSKVGARRISPRALSRFAVMRQREDAARHAWMFSLGHRGVIFVRPTPRPAEQAPTERED